MSIVPFHTMFPDLAFKETRSVTVWQQPGLPDADYGFLELYCTDPSCDCRRVLINVVSSIFPGAILATLNYGWESVAFYRRWLGSAKNAAAFRGVSLDPLNPQTIVAPQLCALFETCLADTAYAERLRSHYRLVKQAVRDSQPNEPPQRPKPRRRP